MKKVIGAQGEITIIAHFDDNGNPIMELPSCSSKPVERNAKGWIISHSESGHHHLLDGGNVIERTDNVPSGMQVLYALLDRPAALIQDAAVPHGSYELPAGLYEMRISREYDPFAQQARRVAD